MCKENVQKQKEEKKEIERYWADWVYTLEALDSDKNERQNYKR